jgi:hypothetical protein
VIRAECDLPGTDGRRGEGWRRGAGWRNDPNNVCTCELNEQIKKITLFKICLVRKIWICIYIFACSYPCLIYKKEDIIIVLL